MKRSLAACAMMVGLLAQPAVAEDAAERLFAPGALESIDEGTVLDFTQMRKVPDGAELGAIAGSEVKIAVEADRAIIRFDIEGRPQAFAQPLGAAHPLLLLFLETSHQSVAELSGGSPFYIKNRIVESFAKAETSDVETPAGTGERLLLKPFANDPNAPRMGDFAGLEIAFVLADVPGGLYSATAAAGSYEESMTWSGEDG